MQLLLDNLLATLISGMIFLMLVVYHVRSSEDSLHATNSYALKQQELNFIETLKQDFQSISRVITPGEQASDSTFWFRVQPQAHDSATVLVGYRRRFKSSEGSDSYYQLERVAGGQSVAVSMVTVTAWDIYILNSQNDTIKTVADLPRAAQVKVRFEAAAPWVEDRTIKRSRWEASFQPPVLRFSGTNASEF